MILIDSAFWDSVGLESFDGNANRNQYDFYRSMVVNGEAINNQKDFFQESTVDGIVYYNQLDWYRAIGVLYSEPIYDQYSFMQNVTFDGVNAVGNQLAFFKYNTTIELNRYFTTLDGSSDYYTMGEVALASDFVFEAYFSTTAATGMITNKIASAQDYIYMSGANDIKLQFPVAASKTFNFAAAHNDGKLNKLVLSRVSGVITCTVNDIASTSGTYANTETLTLSQIGTYQNGSLWFNGVISDVKITDGTDLIRYYKIDEDLSLGSTIIDSGSDGINGTAVSITSSELFTLVGCSWVGSTKTIVIAGCTP